MDQKYLNDAQLADMSKKITIGNIVLLSSDSYSDEEVWKSIRSTGASDMLAACAIQTALVGSGNQVLGEFELNGERMSVRDIYKAKGVIMNSSVGMSLNSGDLTPRRLHRACRLIIRQFLERNPSYSSYLWRKYSNKDEKFRTICYPGSEHLIKTREEAAYLIDVYENLDERKKTNISERIVRVLEARGLV
jgi:hypothetical protein